MLLLSYFYVVDILKLLLNIDVDPFSRGVQQEAPVPVPHHVPHGADPLPGHHQLAPHQRPLRAGPVRLGAQGPGEHAQDGLLLPGGQGQGHAQHPMRMNLFIGHVDEPVHWS